MACGKELLNKVDPEYLNVLLPRLSFGRFKDVKISLYMVFLW